MAQPTIISWTPANWITVVLMVALAYFIVAAVNKTIKSRQGGVVAAPGSTAGMGAVGPSPTPGPYGSAAGAYGVSGGR